MEEETSLDAMPAVARAAILKAAGGAKLSEIEKATRPGQDAYYEATYVGKHGKQEVAVGANGSPVKE